LTNAKEGETNCEKGGGVVIAEKKEKKKIKKSQ